MNVLLPIDTAQNIIFIPRNNSSEVDIILENKLKETTDTYSNITPTYSNGYMTISVTHDFKEGESYSYTINASEGDSLMYRSKIFVTAQTDLQEYNTHPNQSILTI